MKYENWQGGSTGSRKSAIVDVLILRSEDELPYSYKQKRRFFSESPFR